MKTNINVIKLLLKVENIRHCGNHVYVTLLLLLYLFDILQREPP